LKEPQNSLPVQYRALLATEGVQLDFTDDGLHEIARIASEANARAQNIGARRLHTVFERLLEDVSFSAPERSGTTVVVDGGFVKNALEQVIESEDLDRYIL